MEASSAEKKKRAAAKAKNEPGMKLRSAAAAGAIKKRVRDASTEEDALEILMAASSSGARRSKLMHSERAKNDAEAMSAAVPDKVCPAYGQGVPDTRTGIRGGSESFIDRQSAAPLELSATNSSLHTPV